MFKLLQVLQEMNIKTVDCLPHCPSCLVFSHIMRTITWCRKPKECGLYVLLAVLNAQWYVLVVQSIHVDYNIYFMHY